MICFVLGCRMMRKSKPLGIILACCLIIALLPGVLAQNVNNIDQNIVVNQILKGHTIYYGEEHLNITDSMTDTNRVFPYVVSLQDQKSGNVTDSIKIIDPKDFAFPTDKAEGHWYLSPDGIIPYSNQTGSYVVAFVSQEPVLKFDVWNADSDTKLENNSVAYRGNLLRFKYTVDTNLDDITTRPDYNSKTGYMNLKVIAADGNEHLKLMTLEPSTLTTEIKEIINLDVDPTPGWIWPDNRNPSGVIGWWTGWRNAKAGQESDYEYPLGSYNVVGLCNVNNMYKNRDRPGFTWDEKFFNLEQRPLSVTVSNPPVGRDKEFTALISGLPNTTYQIFINDECPPKITGKFCDRPPYIVGDRYSLAQKGIELDSIGGDYRIGSTDVIDCCKEGMKIREIVPSGDAYPSNGGWDILDNGTRYYAEVTTGSDGTVPVPFWVDTTMNKATYTIQVQDVNYKQKATAKVDVTMGAITGSLKDTNGTVSSTFFVGDEIWIDGTNTDSNTSYLWITGPGLDPCGVNLYDPTSYDPVRTVVFDSKNGQSNYWRISPNWATNDTPISAGNYTIWITSSNPESWACTPASCLGIAEEKGVCAIQKCPSCSVWTSIPVTLLKPELTVDPIKDVKRCCCPGYPCGQLGGVDAIWINGTSGGNNCKELQIWMFGQSQFGTKNYLFTVTPTFCDDTFSFDLNKGLLQPNNIDLCQLPTGTYEVIVQVPGANGMFDLGLGASEENGDRFVTTTLPVAGSKVFKIEGKDALSDGVAVKLLKEGLNKAGIDDKYAYISFNLENKACEGNVDFTADRTNGNSPLTVQFTDTSVMKGVSWAWSSNGVLFSNEQNPRYTFSEIGKYSIRLEVTDANNVINSAVKDSFITVLSQPVADFSFGPNFAGINEPVQFTDQSTGSPTSWMWEFGDGNTSSLQSPAHRFSAPGEYNVTLQVSNAFGPGTPKSKTVIVSHDKPVADFIGEPTSSAFFPAEVSFTDLSTGYISSWGWKFIRNNLTTATSTDKNPNITFNEPGLYSVELTVSNDGGKNVLMKENYITVGTGSTINLAPGYNHVSVPRAVASEQATVGSLFAGVDTAGIPFAIYGIDNGKTNWTNVSDAYQVQPLQAIRVYSTGATVITPTYKTTGATFSRNLTIGWNGIGIMAMQPTSANKALASLGDAWDKALAFDAQTQRWEVLISRGVDDDKTMDPTVGYILEMNKDAVLTGSEV